MKDFIDVRRITKQYETAKALNNVSLTIPEGSLTAIVGKSGCGKTTLLNMIGGLDTPSCGEVYVTGKCITAMKERELSRFRAYSKRAALFYGLIGSEVLVGEGINPLFVLLYAAAMILAAYICIRVTVNRFWSIPVRRMLIG